MKINFTKSEFKTLLEMTYLADRMLHLHEDEAEEDEYRLLEQKFMGLAEKFGYGDLVEHDAESGEYFPTSALDDSPAIRSVINNYDDATFWHKLTSRLASRDITRQYSRDDLLNMSEDEKVILYFNTHKKYGEVFESEGLDALTVSFTQQEETSPPETDDVYV